MKMLTETQEVGEGSRKITVRKKKPSNFFKIEGLLKRSHHLNKYSQTSQVDALRVWALGLKLEGETWTRNGSESVRGLESGTRACRKEPSGRE